MRQLAYWVQRGDLSAVDYEAVDAARAINIYSTHDWDEELRFFSQIEKSGADSCPPGIGFVDPDGPILHVCPGAHDDALVHYTTNQSHTLLGFIPTGERMTYTRHGVTHTQVVELIRSFFDGQHDLLVRSFSTAGQLN